MQINYASCCRICEGLKLNCSLGELGFGVLIVGEETDNNPLLPLCDALKVNSSLVSINFRGAEIPDWSPLKSILVDNDSLYVYGGVPEDIQSILNDNSNLTQYVAGPFIRTGFALSILERMYSLPF